MTTIIFKAMRRNRSRRMTHPLQRLGLFTARTSAGRTQTGFGLVFMWMGWYLKRTGKPQRLYTHRMTAGKPVRINVVQGGQSISDTTIGS